MLLIDIHKLDIILADPITLGTLKRQVDRVGRVFGFQGEDIGVLGGAEDFGERVEVNSKSDVAVASKGGKSARGHEHADERDVGVVHCLKGDARVIAVEIAVLN